MVDWLQFQFKLSRDAKSSPAVLHNQNDIVMLSAQEFFFATVNYAFWTYDDLESLAGPLTFPGRFQRPSRDLKGA